MPTIDSAWLDITGNPDLGPLNSPYQEPVDFSIWQARDGTWHIWECIRQVVLGGHARLFYAWEAPDPTAAWSELGVAMTADPSVGEDEGGLQAPYVFDDGGGYRMFYGGWSSICSQTSADGLTFTRVLDANGQCPLVSQTSDMYNPRDAMVLRAENLWHLYYTAAKREVDDTVTSRVFARTSTDLVAWSDASIVSYGGSGGTIGTSTECPFVVHRPDGYYLFRTEQYGPMPLTHVYRSDDPLMFGIDDDRYKVGTLPVAAPELFEYDGRTYIAALKLDTQGIRIAELRWPD